MNYAEWIQAYEERTPHLLGMCRFAATEMAAAFPELRIVCGHVHDGQWGKRGHWWCVTTAGAIVDPTAKQFPLAYEYEEWEPGAPVRVGRCMECGDEIYRSVQTLDEDPGSQTFCNDRCGDNYISAMSGAA